MTENRTPNVISALHRLERAGSEESRQTEKLIAAAQVMGESIAPLVPDITAAAVDQGLCVSLPRGYVAYAGRLSRDGENRVVWTLAQCDDQGFWRTVSAGRREALAFAKDIASGLLDELADWLEARGTEDAEAVARLELAAGAFRQD